MKILITGHLGFIGQNMVKALQDTHELSLYDWNDYHFPTVQGHDWVIHLGAISSTTEQDVEKVMRQNYDFSRRLLNDCIKWNVNLQFSSSASVYGQNMRFSESDPVNPLSPYAWSKYLFERYVKEICPSNIRTQGFRYFNVYGPYEDHKGEQSSPHHKFTKQAETTGVIKLFEGSENYKRDFISVHEVIDLHKEFFDVMESGVWNIGSGRAMSFQNVAETIAEGAGARIEYIPMPATVASQYQRYTCADTIKLMNTLHDKNRSKWNI